MFSQEGHPVAFFSEKFNSKQNTPPTTRNLCCSTSFPLLAAFLIPNEFVLFSDHEALKHINNQKKLNPRHGKWVKFPQAYIVIKHKVGAENKVAEPLVKYYTCLELCP